jgi:hypothetical protein
MRHHIEHALQQGGVAAVDKAGYSTHTEDSQERKGRNITAAVGVIILEV